MNKDNTLIYERYLDMLSENQPGEGMETSWETEDGKLKVTMREVVKYMDDKNVPVKDVDIEKIKPILIDQDYGGKNKDRVSKADTSHPIIVIKSNGKYKSILDGNHRAFKIISTGYDTIAVRELDLDASDTPEEYRELFDYGIDP